ncbi:DUF4136 domain-containing protein [Algoriphagus hitonicola]|uniref:DUF4136 domain-containing protein n=1 Tax=Algoriphagus hitonicola TaxID=435880 RepID=A0A1I2R344_9BACT|nr:DUF4136 domain-containing protein [Algoriphagus hitonicola]SFG35145.1 protein of unknown function [Algoriphagus hitonicola]
MIKSFLHLFFILLATLALGACSSIEVFKENSEIRPAMAYRSFVIVNEEVGMRGFSDAKIDELVQSEIRLLLESQGFVYEKVNPDLIIRYTSNEDQRQREIRNYNTPFPMWGFRVWDPWMYNPYLYNDNFNRSRSSEYELLQVIMDFIDPEKDKFLMTLTGVTEVSSPKYKQKKVLKTTEKVLERFLIEISSTSN